VFEIIPNEDEDPLDRVSWGHVLAACLWGFPKMQTGCVLTHFCV